MPHAIVSAPNYARHRVASFRDGAFVGAEPLADAVFLHLEHDRERSPTRFAGLG
jgi:hypothetical protein